MQLWGQLCLDGLSVPHGLHSVMWQHNAEPALLGLQPVALAAPLPAVLAEAPALRGSGCGSGTCRQMMQLGLTGGSIT